MKIEIYSKENCIECKKAKDYLNGKKIDFIEKILDKDYTKDELLLIAPNVRTLPQIFIDSDLIGGFNNLKLKV